MSDLLPKNSFSRIETADRKIIQDSNKFIKEALIGQTFDPDRMREIGNQALRSGLGGAAFGIPGLIGGAGSALAIGLGEDFLYNLKNNVQKASWQVGIAMEKIQKVANNLQKEIGPQNSQFLSQLASDLKNYVDVAIEKKPNLKYSKDNLLIALKKQEDDAKRMQQQNYNQQMYMNQPQMNQPQMRQQNYYQQQQNQDLPNLVAKPINKKNKRFADDKTKALGEAAGYLGAGTVGDVAFTSAAESALKAAPKGIGFLKGGLLGLGGELLAGSVLDAIENMTPAVQQLQGLASDLNKIFTEVKKLIADNPELATFDSFSNKIISFVNDLTVETNKKLQQAKQLAQQTNK